MRVVCMIPARIESKRCCRKNARLFVDRPLLAWAVRLAYLGACPPSDEVWVSTASRELAKIALGAGARLHERPEALASDETRTDEILRDFAAGREFDWLVVQNPTSPLLVPGTIGRFVGRLAHVPEETGRVLTVLEERSHYLRADGTDWRLTPMNFDGTADPRSQEVRPVVRATWGLTAYRRRLFEDAAAVTWAGQAEGFPISAVEAVDVDTEEDFWIAETLARARGAGRPGD